MIGNGSDFSKNPLLVFWETTRACPLSCRHCRASAISHPLEDELSHEEGIGLMEGIAAFGQPRPVVIMTGGDCMMRSDLVELVREGRNRQLSIALSPAASSLLETGKLAELRSLGIRSLSLSLDGSTAETHDRIRGTEGHFGETLKAASRLVAMGFSVQINTTVMPDNVEQLADIALILRQLGIKIWEVFFLVTVGRGEQLKELSPEQNEDVCNFLAEMTRHGFTVRTVEAPFFRRILAKRARGAPMAHEADGEAHGELYRRLMERASLLLGLPQRDVVSSNVPTRDGKGIIFVSQNGEVYPSGFLPYSVGSVRSKSITDIYRNNSTLISIRNGEFRGRCGVCEYRDVCGGSRSRAFSHSGDVLAEDPGCAYIPHSS